MNPYKKTTAQKRASRDRRERLHAGLLARQKWTDEQVEAEEDDLREEVERRIAAGEVTLCPPPAPRLFSALDAREMFAR